MHRLADLSGIALVERVVEGNAILREARDLVAVVLQDPWKVRRPRDLARQAGVTLGAVKRRCGSRLRRIENFIALTRWVALEHLTVTLGVGPKLARVLTGVADRSNFRHQVRRLRRIGVLIALLIVGSGITVGGWVGELPKNTRLIMGAF